MRVSERQRYKTSAARVDSARQNNVNNLEQISTLKRINKISDDPIGAGKVIRGRDRISNIQQYQKNVEFSKGYIERSEAAVRGISDNLIRAKELAVAMANSTYDAKSREATAKEVQQILSEVVKLGNTNYAGRYVFSGFRTGTPPLSEDGQYLGDDGILYLQTDDGDFRQINIRSRYLFEADPADREQGHFGLVDTLQILHDGLTHDDVDSVRVALDELDYQLQKTTSFQASIGALHTSLGSAGRKLDTEEVDSMQQLSKVEDVDMFKATSDFHRSEAVLQSTLLASNKMLQPSLLNFMQ